MTSNAQKTTVLRCSVDELLHKHPPGTPVLPENRVPVFQITTDPHRIKEGGFIAILYDPKSHLPVYEIVGEGVEAVRRLIDWALLPRPGTGIHLVADYLHPIHFGSGGAPVGDPNPKGIWPPGPAWNVVFDSPFSFVVSEQFSVEVPMYSFWLYSTVGTAAAPGPVVFSLPPGVTPLFGSVPVSGGGFTRLHGQVGPAYYSQYFLGGVVSLACSGVVPNGSLPGPMQIVFSFETIDGDATELQPSAPFTVQS